MRNKILVFSFLTCLAVQNYAEQVSASPSMPVPSDILAKTSTDEGPKPLPLRTSPNIDLTNPLSGTSSLGLDAQTDSSVSGFFARELVSQMDAPSEMPPPDAPADRAPLDAPDPAEFEELQRNLDSIEELGEIEDPADFSSPGITIAIPSGYGVDGNTFFISGTFQERTRNSNSVDGGLALGVGLFDSRQAVGAEISYTIASFGNNRSFGSGGFNAKIHRRFSESFSVAVGWNGFLNIGDDNDFEDSIYGSATKIFRTRESVNQAFSRIAITAGAGTGQFRTEEDFLDDVSSVSPFGSVAVRIVEPVSFITEWTGQDLALGVSIAPFNNFNFVITPALRDITGAGDGARFVLGFGTSFQF